MQPTPTSRPLSAAKKEELSKLSPFELKNTLIAYARDHEPNKVPTRKLLNAGRGNPNWIATTPREAFMLLNEFLLLESKRVWDEPHLGGMPQAAGIAGRLAAFLEPRRSPGAAFLSRAVEYGITTLGFQPDAFVHELTDALTGDNYPEPDRMLVHCEAVVARFLEQEMFGGRRAGFQYFATEGGTAAMCNLFISLKANRLLNPGDTIALGTPIFTPYLEIPHLEDFGLDVIHIEASELSAGAHTWQYPASQLAKLADPKVKAFFLVNPSNPPSVGMSAEGRAQLAELVKQQRPDLLVLTDDVYSTFVPGFRSIADELPRNTILVYSFSKHFGCTGWRLGVIGTHEDNVVDALLSRHPGAIADQVNRRYSALVEDPSTLKFIDRVVADSRLVALNHTAGLSLPQQTQMTLFSLFGLLPEGVRYKERCREIVHERLAALARGLGIEIPQIALRAGYYVELDLAAWGTHHFGPTFLDYVNAHHDPLDIVLALARRYGIVLLHGGGFEGPPWSVRVSLANLMTPEYEPIGAALRDVAERALEGWRRSTAH